MKKYTKIKSNFIKEKIKTTKFEDRDYIEDLMFLERVILNNFEGLGMSGNMKLQGLKSRYKKEYEVIYKELDPKGWEKDQKSEKKEREKERIEEKRFDEEEMLEEEQDKRDWKKAGGKL